MKNELDQKLETLQKGDLDITEFMQFLLTTQVFMPIENEKSAVGGFQAKSQAQPLIISSDDFDIMPVFSDPSRSKVFLNNYPDYADGLLVEISWILERIAPNMGISINPEIEIGLDLDPNTIQQLVTLNNSKEQK